jgi:hypothetical protein
LSTLAAFKAYLHEIGFDRNFVEQHCSIFVQHRTISYDQILCRVNTPLKAWLYCGLGGLDGRLKVCLHETAMCRTTPTCRTTNCAVWHKFTYMLCCTTKLEIFLIFCHTTQRRVNLSYDTMCHVSKNAVSCKYHFTHVITSLLFIETAQVLRIDLEKLSPILQNCNHSSFLNFKVYKNNSKNVL